jgi:ABC-type dipeptide/oligopeptide/nickel transport system permease subunit
VILATLAAPWISPSDPYDAVNSLRNAPPGTPGFLLGADSDGRDVLVGLGIQPPAADWGTMVSDGRVALKTAPHITIFPGILIGLVSLAFNFLGDGLTAMLDPRARRG